MKPVKGIPSSLKNEMRRFFARRKEVKAVFLFGSRARGDADLRSDIDLAISIPKTTTRQWLDISFFLKESVHSLLKIDAIRLEDASHTLKNNIHREGMLLYARS